MREVRFIYISKMGNMKMVSFFEFLNRKVGIKNYCKVKKM